MKYDEKRWKCSAPILVSCTGVGYLPLDKMVDLQHPWNPRTDLYGKISAQL